MNIKAILSGWKNFIDKSEVVEELAKKRAVICAACPEAKKAMLLKWVPEDSDFTEIQGFECSVCHCPLSAKIRSIDTCPKNKWNE